MLTIKDKDIHVYHPFLFCFENIYSPLSCLLNYINNFIIFILSLNWYIYIYVKPMNSMVLDNKQYNIYSAIRVQNKLSLILLGYNKTIACNTRTFAWRSSSHTAHARIYRGGGSPDTPRKIKMSLNYIIKSPNNASDPPPGKLK